MTQPPAWGPTEPTGRRALGWKPPLTDQPLSWMGDRVQGGPVLFGPSRDLGKALPVASFPADGRLCPSIVSDPRPRDTRRLSQLCQGSSPSNSGDFLDGPVSLPSTRGLRVSPEPERPGSEPSPAPLLPVGAPPLLTSACPALSPRPCRAGCLGKGHHLSRCPSRGGNR